ncbi:MAG: hypothetical protein EXS49_01600 [Candidatus Pacebacteria bacterium]|nr:hypothetical protein [Candidatus Paceibacterota bacterium]
MEQEVKGGGRSVKFIVLIVVLVGVAVFVSMWKNGTETFGSSDSYQAVFLTNGNTYFGKLSRMNSQYPILSDIYYINVTQIQPRSKDDQSQQAISLVKFGGEIHGPVDKMAINRDQILFIEDLRSDSKVVQGIMAQNNLVK